MKEKCDNRCDTCPMPTQVHCAVLFSRTINMGMINIVDKLCHLENLIKGDATAPITPRGFEPCIELSPDSEKLPAPEVGV